MKTASVAWMVVWAVVAGLGAVGLRAEESGPSQKGATVTEAELREQLEQLERENQLERARHKKQMDMLAVMQRQAVASHDKAATEQVKQLIEEEKARHDGVIKSIAAKWAEVKAEVDARK